MKDDAAQKISPEAPRHLAVVTGTSPSVKGRLLIVDDEPHILEGLTLHLRRKYAIVARRSATDALRALATEGPFVAVISDLRMPGMDGVQFLVEVRRRAPHTCRLLLTGYGDMSTAVAAINEAGVHRLLTKPCPPAILAAALENAIASARESRLVAAIDIVDLAAARPSPSEPAGEPSDGPDSPAANQDIGILDLVRIRLGGADEEQAPPSEPRTPRVENVELGSLVCAARDALHHAGVVRHGTIRIALPDLPLYVRGDGAVLEAMISNLLKNGAEAIEAHAHDRAAIASLLTAPTPEPAIRVQVSADGATARIEVIDNGRSIADTNLDRLFDTYVASKPAETETGLGLAIVREIVSRHHGKIWAEIIPSGGTRFVVELPIAERARGREVDALSDIRALTPRE